MENVLDEIELYHEKVLQMQYNVSECITHPLTKGEIREDFIKKVIRENIQSVITLKGIVVSNGFQSSQIDLIIPRRNAILNPLGEQNIINVNDVKNIFEIKSNLRMEHIKKFNQTLKVLKNANPNIKGGIICYKIECLEKYILKYFGYYYDTELESFQKSKDNITYQYPDIDYIISFDEEKEFILSKDILGDFVLNKKIPIFNNFLMIFNNGGE